MKRRLVPLLAIPILLFCSFWVSPPKAQAWSNSGLPTCNIDLSWDWKTKVTQAMIAADPTTPYSVESYAASIMIKDSNNNVNLYLGSNGYFDKDLSTNTYYYRIADSNATYTPTRPTQFTLNVSSKTVSAIGTTPNSYTGLPFYTNPPSTPDVSCVRYAQGFVYNTNYDGIRFGSVMPQEQSTSCNGALDVGCWISKAFNGVTNTITDVAKASLKAFTDLWLPDGTAIQAKFNELSTFFQNKLGFLTYPFVFLHDLFNSFSGSGTWCSPSDCSWSGSTMNGGHFTLDLLALKHGAFSSVWDYFVLFVRGTTMVALVFELNRKMQEILSK